MSKDMQSWNLLLYKIEGMANFSYAQSAGTCIGQLGNQILQSFPDQSLLRNVEPVPV